MVILKNMATIRIRAYISLKIGLVGLTLFRNGGSPCSKLGILIAAGFFVGKLPRTPSYSTARPG